jgi:phosphohistidine phosphatase
MDIYFLRHASAGDNKASTPQEDEKRPLDAKGIEQSKQMGKLLAALEIKPDAFVSSPLTRAVQTAELVAEQLKGGSSITLDDALRPDASYEQFQDLLQHYARQKTITVTGHNPNLSEFLSILISGTSKTAVELKKGAVAKVEYKSGKATLHWCVTPKLLGVAQESAPKTSSRPKTSRK